MYSVHDSEGNNPFGVWFPYETRALARLYKLIMPKHWKDYIDLLAKGLLEEQVINREKDLGKLKDRIRPVYNITQIIKYRKDNEMSDIKVQGISSILQEAAEEMYTLLYDKNNKSTTYRIGYDVGEKLYYLSDDVGNNLTNEKFTSELTALTLLYVRFKPEKWRVYYKKLYPED